MNETKLGLYRQFSTEEKFKAEQNSSSPTIPEKRKAETLLAQTGALISDHVTILPFEGLNDDKAFGPPPENTNWQEKGQLGPEQKQFIYGMMSDQRVYSFAEALRKNDQEKMWSMIQDQLSSNKIIEAFNGEIPDITNLSPYEAAKLSGLIVADKMQYDYAILSDKRLMSKLPNVERLKMIRHKLSGKNSFHDYLEARRFTRDTASADQLLDSGWGVCRHMAVVSSAIFETLKLHQQGDTLRDADLLYYSPSGQLYESASDDVHAYNILVHLGGPTEIAGRELSLSILDPTWAKSEKLDLDQTYRRLSSSLIFLQRFGGYLGVPYHDDDVKQLADEVLSRINKPPENFGQFKDWAALLKYSSELWAATPEQTVNYIMERVEEKDVPTTIANLFKTPQMANKVVMKNSVQRLLNIGYVEPIFNWINKIDLAKNDDATVFIRQQINLHITIKNMLEDEEFEKNLGKDDVLMLKTFLKCVVNDIEETEGNSVDLIERYLLAIKRNGLLDEELIELGKQLKHKLSLK